MLLWCGCLLILAVRPLLRYVLYFFTLFSLLMIFYTTDFFRVSFGLDRPRWPVSCSVNLHQRPIIGNGEGIQTLSSLLSLFPPMARENPPPERGCIPSPFSWPLQYHTFSIVLWSHPSTSRKTNRERLDALSATCLAKSVCNQWQTGFLYPLRRSFGQVGEGDSTIHCIARLLPFEFEPRRKVLNAPAHIHHVSILLLRPLIIQDTSIFYDEYTHWNFRIKHSLPGDRTFSPRETEG